MAKNRKAAKSPTTIDADGYATDGMYRWSADQTRPGNSQTSPEELKQRIKETKDDLRQPWQDRLAEIREWLLEIAAPHWEGPLGDDYFWQDEQEGSEGWGHEVDGRMRWRRIVSNELMVVGDQYYRVFDPNNVPGYARAAIELFCLLDGLAKKLESGTDLNSIVREAINLGREIESIQDRAEFAPLVLSGRITKIERPKLMRDKKAELDRERKRGNQQHAEQAMAQARDKFPEKAFDGDDGTLEEEAAKIIGKSRRTLNRWLGGK